ncbi:MAG TPA: energy transducer TonB [Rhizomicrobium sp.]|nr:energy transducer TonB [Rhizomicrobium sp.]
MRTIVISAALTALATASFAGDASLVNPRIPPGEAHSCTSFYPTQERERMAQSIDVVHFTVTETGAVKDPAIVQRSGDDPLDRAAIACVTTWHYVPATKDGTAVAVDWTVRLNWKQYRHDHRGMTGEFAPLARTGYRP